jgi:ATP-binding cassette subfamily F protein 3
MSILNSYNLTKYYGAELIFKGIGFQVARGEKIALVGVNGAGKSTLLKMVAGIEEPTAGNLGLARGMRVAYLAQEARFEGDRTLLEEMHAAVAYLAQLQLEMTELEHALADTNHPDWERNMAHYGELTHRFELAGGYELEHRIDRTLHGLGFEPEQYDQRVAQFSGGQKTRAALAATLLSDPDLLLLDEPTNHLDLAALEWLERFLKTWAGTLIVISHDRYFLDKVTNRTLEMVFGRLEDYPAGYNKYLELKAERLELQMKQYQSQQEEIAKIEEFVRRFKAGQRSKEARGREKRLNRMKEGWTHVDGTSEKLIDRPQDQKKLSLNLQTQSRSGDVVLRFDGLAVGYQVAPNTTRTLIHSQHLELRRGQRVGLIGPNGAGKTTLLRTLVGEIAPLRGQFKLGYGVKLNYYAQSHEGLNMDSTIINEIWRVAPQLKETQIRTMLGRFLFSGDDVFKRVGDLSGGERSRVALAQLTLMSGNLLVLDEPTNHLDIDARGALETVLNDYQGTILFVSHDRYFIDAVADTIWEVRNATIKRFDGNYSEWSTARDKAEAASKAPEPASKPTTNGSVSPKAISASQAHSNGAVRDQSKEDRKRQRRLTALEGEIALLEQELKQVEADLQTTGLTGDVQKITALGMQHAEIQEMLDTRYNEWSELAS